MNGTVTISIEDFERLRKIEESYIELAKKCVGHITGFEPISPFYAIGYMHYKVSDLSLEKYIDVDRLCRFRETTKNGHTMYDHRIFEVSESDVVRNIGNNEVKAHSFVINSDVGLEVQVGTTGWQGSDDCVEKCVSFLRIKNASNAKIESKQLYNEDGNNIGGEFILQGDKELSILIEALQIAGKELKYQALERLKEDNPSIADIIEKQGV